MRGNRKANNTKASVTCKVALQCWHVNKVATKAVERPEILARYLGVLQKHITQQGMHCKWHEDTSQGCIVLQALSDCLLKAALICS